MVSKVNYLSKATLNGVAQIMFQENLLTGIIIVIGVAIGSLNFAAALLLSSFSGAFTADLLGYDKSKIEQGLYSFSAALVGVAALLFFRSHLITWSFVIIGGALAALIQHLSIKKGVAIYTLPFVLITWLAISLAYTLYPSLIVGAGELTSSSYGAFLFPLKGIGQVIFQGKLSTAILFFLALLISSPRVAFWAVGAALLSGILASIYIPTIEIENGLWSFNAVLAVIPFVGKGWRALIWSATAIVLAVAIQYLLYSLQIIALTFPFVVTAIILVQIREFTCR